jgi:GNAT superfamily N-acetyltransferase
MMSSRFTKLRRAIAARIEVRAFARDLIAPVELVRPHIDVRIRPAALDDVPRLAQVVAPVYHMLYELEAANDLETALGDLLRRGQMCYIAERGGAIVHFRWGRRTDASMPRLGLTAPLRPDEVYVFSSYTVPPLRGERLGPAVMSQMLADMRAQGMRLMYVWVMSGNTPALHAAGHWGGVEIGRVVQWVWRAGQERLIYATVSAAAEIGGRPGLCTLDRLQLRRPLVAVRYHTIEPGARSSPHDVASVR